MKVPTVVSGKAWQRLIREKVAIEENGVAPAISDIKRAACSPISYQDAESIILKYEWLGTMAQGMYCFGIFYENTLAGAVCLGLPASPTAGDMFGTQFRHLAICIERGACTWWAHPHSASKLIMYAVKWMSSNTKYRIFFAYSDEDAGEIGTVYQACNFMYMGKSAGGGSQNKLVDPNGVVRDSRHILRIASRVSGTDQLNRTEARKVLHSYGWSDYRTKPKSKYVIVHGPKREVRAILNNARFEPLPYPKRPSECGDPGIKSLPIKRFIPQD